jgi:hypothetical protein
LFQPPPKFSGDGQISQGFAPHLGDFLWRPQPLQGIYRRLDDIDGIAGAEDFRQGVFDARQF